MSKQRPQIRYNTIDSSHRARPTHVLQPLRPPTPRPPQSTPPLLPSTSQPPSCPQIEAVLLHTLSETWETPRKALRKMPKSSSLSLAMRSKGGKDSLGSPMSPRSPGSLNAVYGNDSEAATPIAAYHNMPESPASPKQRKDSKNIFANFHASKSSTRIASPDDSLRQGPDQNGPLSFYTNGRNGGSTPELNRPIQTPNSEGKDLDNRSDITGSEPRTNSRSGKSTELDSNADSNPSKRGTAKPKKQGVLSRSRSIKVEEGSNQTKQKPTPRNLAEPSSWKNNSDGMPLKTAPLEKGQSWRQNISFGKLRTHSADRHDGSQHAHGDDDTASRKDRAEQSSVASGSFNESRGAALMSSIGFGARKMGEKMDSARKGMFGKLGRSSSNHETQLQIPKEQYVFRVINLGLVEQTRLTRISQRLENSKDKTEFWMPALPWRCIDYLNMKGCEEEGLYRVPGAAHTVRYYEQKFDQDRDIDLIADDNLNDPNVIGSLFKSWLRQLPDEIFPKATQSKIQQECQGAKTTPQMLKDELSKLPPFNYYLLFAITCHISLLHSCSEFNKMNYNNLCICFQPAIKIDAFCFQFLILDWRNCWQGCWTEKEYLVEEVKLLEPQKPEPSTTRNGQAPQASGKTKSLHSSSGFLGDSFQSSTRSNSADRAVSSDRASERSKPSSRGLSAERNMVSGRVTPPNPSIFEHSSAKRPAERRATDERDSSTDRAISSSDSRDAFNARGTPKRAPASLSTEVAAEEEDNSATPTQAQHTRGGSESNNFRLDITNPPSSPFSIKF
ncbi:uncharacterized protein BDR25DRAFT_322847 [Lindgomyces ingoldianus]|uniref:Uncharacterized protein n=1 Tax=Lindgomyces ingoldianus TaxID=673940 RepID=A0ACB6R6F1_9PLEO|nr:uncharacterized protein BDR25DRAFT_322847 [Lindgomyces ingoldianus]KAF2474645.1 hypothetical protein BDR25DRAFT_322847 [Lindgomyces ingoldianus]